MSTTVKERLVEFLEHKGINKSEFGRRIGVSSAFVTSMRKSIQPDKIHAIRQEFPDLNIDWLLTGEGEMLAKKYIVDEITIPTQEEVDALREDIEAGRATVIPLLPVEAMAGTLSHWADQVELRDCKKIVSPIPGADFAIQISGDSMEPELHNNSYVYIKRINERAFIPWGHSMVVDTVNGVVVKKLFPIDNDDTAILARSVNPNYPPFRIPTDAILGIYRVLGGSFVVSTM